MKILAIDTSSQVCSVAVCTDVPERCVVSEFNINTKLMHSQTVMPMCRQALDCANIQICDIDAFAVAQGPGSFTGLRIGISAVKGMCMMGTDLCIGVSSLRGLAYNFLGNDCIVCSVMDARCGQVYNALFRVQNDRVIRMCEDRSIQIEDLQTQLLEFVAQNNDVAGCDKKSIVLVGDGADLCYNRFQGVVPNIALAPPTLRFQRAAGIAFAAFDAIAHGETTTAEQIVPNYLKLSQAERERLQMLHKD